MAIHIRKSGDRGYFNYGWLKTYHTFSFANYDDPAYRGFRSLRVLNEDRIRPGTGFPLHAHQDMEIFSLVIEGGLAHQDDLGNASILRPGQIQLLTAGRGVTHSEYNASDKDLAHFLQIWILPIDRKLKPSYQEKFFSPALQQNQFCLIISSDGREGSLHIHQNVDIYLATLDQGKELRYELAPNRYGWVQLIKGEIELNNNFLEAGDGASISETSSLYFRALLPSQLAFLDLN
jgi:redox-sensitive bicupin YhaK (pirin superfamily)